MPGLFFHDAHVAEIKKRIQGRRLEYVWKELVQTADKVVREGSLLFKEDTLTIYYYARERMGALALVALVTREEAFIRALEKEVLALCERDLNFWIGPEYPNRPRQQTYRGEKVFVGELETAALTVSLILALDFCGHLMDDGIKGRAFQCLKDKAYLLLKNSTLFQSENWVMIHLCVIASAFTLCSLLLDNQNSCFTEDLPLIRKALGLWLRTVEDDGSYGEGYHYFTYPVNALSLALLALKHNRGIELAETARLGKSFEWALYNQAGQYGETGEKLPVATAVNAYDSPFYFQMEAPEALFFANYFKNPLAQWYIEKFLLVPLGRPDCLHTAWHRLDALLPVFYEEAFKGCTPEEGCLSPSRVFHDTGFVYLRDGWGGMDKETGDTVLALQSGGGGRARSHQHYDKNSFCLFAGGEYWVADPGHSCYRGKAHSLFDTKTASHNTVTLNGEDQFLEFLEKGMEPGERKKSTSFHNRAVITGKAFYPELDYVKSSAARCYKPSFRVFDRHVWYVKTGYFLIYDQVDAGRKGQVLNGFQINNSDGKTLLTASEEGLLAERPHSGLFIKAVFPEEGFSRKDGILHKAYHIFPGMKVEGLPGSAVRLEFNGTGEEGKADFLYILCPVGKGGEKPDVKALGQDGRDGVAISFRGIRDEFLLNAEEGYIRFTRDGGASYLF